MVSSPIGDVLIETTFSGDMKEALRSYRACHRVAVVGGYAACFVLVVGGIVTRSLLLIVVGAVILAWSEFSVRRQLRTYRHGNPGTVVITEDEYRVMTGDRRVTRTWATFESVRRRGGFWVLRISHVAAMALPTRALDANQTAVFEDLLRRKGLLRD